VASKAPVIDLDAHRRESVYPDGITLRFGGEEFVLPAQFPLEVLDPFLDEDLGLVEIIRDFVKDDEQDDVASILDTLVSRPGLPKQAVGAVSEALEILFGAEQWQRFVNSPARPGAGDYLFIGRNLIRAYGVTLGEAFASPDSAENGGATLKPTSPASDPTSTSNGSGSLEEALAAAGVVEPEWDPVPSPAAILPVPTAAPLAEQAPAPVPVPTPQD
jgi:hypothetical protein